MFTGIVRTLLRIEAMEYQNEIMRLALVGDAYATEGLQTGASLSVDGVCLTVTAIDNQTIWFDVIPETLNRTTLGYLQLGEFVNVERAARYGDEIGGHLVSGHVMGTGEVMELEQFREHSRLTCRVPSDWMRYLPLKAFVAINGASLTVADTYPQGLFAVHLIPETLKRTTIGKKKIGQRLNIEIDSHLQAVIDAQNFAKSSQ